MDHKCHRRREQNEQLELESNYTDLLFHSESEEDNIVTFLPIHSLSLLLVPRSHSFPLPQDSGNEYVLGELHLSSRADEQ